VDEPGVLDMLSAVAPVIAGLGLELYDVELNGGAITVASEKGRGTRVAIRLPAPPSASA